ncbi:MAG: phosphopantothenoylcysteine decarboxylase, partial [Armatimonadota bacterium]
LLARQRDLSGWCLLVTAGPTRQWIDPVRFISNPSTGKMGYAVAEAAVSRGAEVVLISGPTFLDAPAGVNLRRVETTFELLDAAVDAFEHCDAAVCAAAPADHAPQAVAHTKIKREPNSKTADSVLELKLYPTPDVAAELGRRKGSKVLVVFAAETEDLIENARRKMQSKNADMVVANDVTSPSSGFGADTNQVCLICADGSVEQLPLMSKSALAHEILNRMVPLLQQRRPRNTSKE